MLAVQPVTFAGTATDPDGDAVTVLWTFGDGATSASLTPPAHTFALAGSSLVTFTATDARGLSNTTPATRTITVTPSTVNQPPDSTITAPAGNVTITVGQSVSFAGTATDPTQTSSPSRGTSVMAAARRCSRLAPTCTPAPAPIPSR